MGNRRPRRFREGFIDTASGHWVRVDPEDQDLEALAWSLSAGYACTTNKRIKMHRIIMERTLGRALEPDEVVDHINRDRVDNRRSNLRAVHQAENAMNNGLPPAESGFVGVHRSGTKWRAIIRVPGKQLYIGCFDDPETAAWFYDQWALSLRNTTILNFEYVAASSPRAVTSHVTTSPVTLDVTRSVR